MGMDSFSGGRIDEKGADELLTSFRRLNIKTGRLKTGTTPRLDRRTINFSVLNKQQGDIPVPRFSYRTGKDPGNHELCYITYTNEDTHEIIESNFYRAPMFSGQIEGVGPRYCPSIEDKISRFRDRPRHQIFVEPQTIDETEYYINGMSTSLPIDVQLEMVRSVAGMEEAKIVRYGYAIEYDYIQPTDLKHTLETKKIKGLYTAGQINGTTGYEEAGQNFLQKDSL